MLAGVWVLVLIRLPLALYALDLGSSVPIPNFFDRYGSVRALDDTLLGSWGVYEPVMFCMGTVLLFTRERGRRSSRFDWTRRWGIICSYVLFLITAADMLFIWALVLTGISAVLLDMPLRYQPHATMLLVRLSTGYLRYGAQPRPIATAVLTVFSSFAILFACIPLFAALRSCCNKWIAALVLLPLVAFSLMHVTHAGAYAVGGSNSTWLQLTYYRYYFWAGFIEPGSQFPGLSNLSETELIVLEVEVIKWFTVCAIALWLTVAQFAAWWARIVLHPNSPNE